jgi:hypothetical protein
MMSEASFTAYFLDGPKVGEFLMISEPRSILRIDFPERRSSEVVLSFEAHGIASVNLGAVQCQLVRTIDYHLLLPIYGRICHYTVKCAADDSFAAFLDRYFSSILRKDQSM